MPRNYKHDDSIRQYRVTWRTLATPATPEPFWTDSHHAYTDTVTAAMTLADGLQAVRGATIPMDVRVFAWNGLGYVQVRGA